MNDSMTEKEAMAEAEKRWGSTGNAHQLGENDFMVFDAVGTKPGSAGRGTTWEGAFADADQRIVKD